MDENMKKKRITVSINKQILEKLENLTSNKSKLVEHILLQYLNEFGIDIKNIIL